MQIILVFERLVRVGVIESLELHDLFLNAQHPRYQSFRSYQLTIVVIFQKLAHVPLNGLSIWHSGLMLDFDFFLLIYFLLNLSKEIVLDGDDSLLLIRVCLIFKSILSVQSIGTTST